MEAPTFDRINSGNNLVDMASVKTRHQNNKNLLLEWVQNADFTKELSLTSLGDHPFQLEDSESIEELTPDRIKKIIKV